MQIRRCVDPGLRSVGDPRGQVELPIGNVVHGSFLPIAEVEAGVDKDGN